MQISLVLLSDGISNYDYDKFGRIINYKNQRTNRNYSYDPNGNISVNESFVYGRTNEFPCIDVLLSDGKNEFTYDELGNITSYKDKRMEYTNGTLLASYEDSKSKHKYFYDFENKRIQKDNIKYIYNERKQLVSIMNGDDSMFFLYNQYGLKLGFIYKEAFYCYVYDGIGNIISVIDAAGNKVANYSYDAFGNITFCSGTLSRLNPFRYKGYFFDEESRLYYLNSRYYDPSICRFLSIDNVDNILSKGYFTDLKINLYAYCLSNPVTNQDNEGNEVAISLAVCSAILVIASFVLGVSFALLANSIIATLESNELLPNLTNPSMPIGQTELKEKIYQLLNAMWAVITKALTIVKKRNTEKHHIIPKNAKNTRKARNNCINYLQSINNPINLVNLAYQFHKVIHINLYYSTIEAYFGEAIEKWSKETEGKKEKEIAYTFGISLCMVHILLKSISIIVFGV